LLIATTTTLLATAAWADATVFLLAAASDGEGDSERENQNPAEVEHVISVTVVGGADATELVTAEGRDRALPGAAVCAEVGLLVAAEARQVTMTGAAKRSHSPGARPSAY
ncbi:MAG: hypothetical protein KBD62_34660, partial [Kofleriaceae bacterium]|nr:hypothetical protein [Kofleriaceae bacterium]